MHADHVTGTGVLKQKSRGAKSVIGKNAGAHADVFIDDGDSISFGYGENKMD